jgi:hypothetical protein
LYRPWKLLFTQPIIQVLACYNAYNFGILYLFIRTFPELWEKRYGESIGVGSLNFISLVVGNLAASQIFAPCNDAIYRTLMRRYDYLEDMDEVPEFRLPLMVFGAIVAPVGLFWVCSFHFPYFCYLPQSNFAADKIATVWMVSTNPPLLAHAQHRCGALWSWLAHMLPMHSCLHRGLLHVILGFRFCRHDILTLTLLIQLSAFCTVPG